MSQNELKLRVLFDVIDRATKPLKAVLQGNRQLAQSFKTSHERLKALNRAQKELASFRSLRDGMRQTSEALKTAQQRLQALSERIKASDAPTVAMTRKFSQASIAVTQLSQHYQIQGSQLKALQNRLTTAGVQTGRLGEHERRLRTDISATNTALSSQQAKLNAVAASEKKLSVARERMQKMQSGAAHLAVGGYATRTTGLRALGSVSHTLGEAKQTQTEVQRIHALGLGKAISADAVRFAQGMQTVGTSTAENLTLVRDAMTVFADLPHAKLVAPTLAKMKFANEALYGGEDAAANEQRLMNMLKVIELRGGLASESRFKAEADFTQKVSTATGGRVGSEQWLELIQTGGVAAKQMRSDAFYYQLEPLVQEMGGHAVGTGLMSAYSNLYQGKTTVKAAKELQRLGLIDPKKVVYNKIGMLKEFKAGALQGGELFKQSPLEWLEQVLLPALAKKGITQPDQIKDVIATIFSNRTASNLFTTLFMQRAQIHKSAKLNAGAEGIEALNQRALNTARGKEIILLGKLHNLKLALGEQVLPLYNRALDKVTKGIEQLSAWMRKHEKVTKLLTIGFAALGVVLAAAGTLTIALAAALGPLAIVKFSLATLGIKSLGVVRALKAVGRLFPWLWGLIAANPVTAVIIGLALGALYIWRNWDKLGPMFAKLWEQIKQKMSEAGDWLTEKWQQLTEGLRQLTDRFIEIGAGWMQGLMIGFTQQLNALKQTLVGTANKLMDWAKAPLSPSGASPLSTWALGGVPLSMSEPQPMTMRTARSPTPINGDTINVTIQGTPGMDATAIAQAVRAELDKHQRAKAARFASRFSD